MRKKKLGRLFASVVLALGFGVTGGVFSTSTNAHAEQTQFKDPALANIKNVILLIGDGMGPNQVKAGEIFQGAQSAINSMPHSTYSLTRSANNMITDSAAGGTAIATGVRTNNGYVGIDTIGNSLTTIMDVALQEGKRTGVVTTDILSGATPMSFSAHCNDRDNAAQLLSSAAQSGVNLFAATSGASTLAFENEGYTNVQNVDDISTSTSEYVIGSYNIKASATSQSAETNSVAFDRVVRESIEYLSQDKDGFVLMAEGAKIDKQCHSNNFFGMIEEMIAFDDAVQTAIDWAKDRNDTVVIVTADHETGGLSLESDITKENMDVKHSWSSTGHTPTNVYCNVYGTDVNFLRYSSTGSETEIKNTDIFKMMKTFVVGYQQANITVKNSTPSFGSVTLDKTECFIGQTLQITLTPAQNYRIRSFKINGEERSDDLHNDGTLNYVIDAGEVELCVEFETAPSDSFGCSSAIGSGFSAITFGITALVILINKKKEN